MNDEQLIGHCRSFADHCERVHPAGAQVVRDMADRFEATRKELSSATAAVIEMAEEIADDPRDTRHFGFAVGDRIRLANAGEGFEREVIGYCCCGRLVTVTRFPSPAAGDHIIERHSDPSERWELVAGKPFSSRLVKAQMDRETATDRQTLAEAIDEVRTDETVAGSIAQQTENPNVWRRYFNAIAQRVALEAVRDGGIVTPEMEALAKIEIILPGYYSIGEQMRCPVCVYGKATIDEYGCLDDDYTDDQFEHADNCIWVRARQLTGDQP